MGYDAAQSLSEGNVLSEMKSQKKLEFSTNVERRVGLTMVRVPSSLGTTILLVFGLPHE